MIIIIIIIIEFLTSELVGGFLMESGWLQVSFSLQDSPEYSSRPKQCNCLDSLGSFSDNQICQFFF